MSTKESFLEIPFSPVRLAAALKKLGLWVFFFFRHPDLVFRQFDIVFFSGGPVHLAMLTPVIGALKTEKPGLRVLLAAEGRNADTTPNLETAGIPVRVNMDRRTLHGLKTKILYTPYSSMNPNRVPNNAHLVHGLHSLANLQFYPPGAFDAFNAVVLGGPHQRVSFEQQNDLLPEARRLELVNGGYPEFDSLQDALSISPQKSERQVRTILYAPTWVTDTKSPLSSFESHGVEIIRGFIDANFNVLFRPHSALFVSSKTYIENLISCFGDHPRFEIDDTTDKLESFRRADCLVTDVSGVGFDFALTTLKPVVLFSTSKEAESALYDDSMQQLATIISPARSVEELTKTVQKIVDSSVASDYSQLREYLIYNPGQSSRFIALYLLTLLQRN